MIKTSRTDVFRILFTIDFRLNARLRPKECACLKRAISIGVFFWAFFDFALLRSLQHGR